MFLLCRSYHLIALYCMQSKSSCQSYEYIVHVFHPNSYAKLLLPPFRESLGYYMFDR